MNGCGLGTSSIASQSFRPVHIIFSTIHASLKAQLCKSTQPCQDQADGDFLAGSVLNLLFWGGQLSWKVGCADCEGFEQWYGPCNRLSGFRQLTEDSLKEERDGDGNAL